MRARVANLLIGKGEFEDEGQGGAHIDFEIWGVRLVWDDFLIKLLDFWKLSRLEWGNLG